jgi:hypothetical protein
MRKITKQERRLRITAYHEAGPAMAMFLYGFRIASVSIVPMRGHLDSRRASLAANAR